MRRIKFNKNEIHNRILTVFDMIDHYHLSWSNLGHQIHALDLPISCEVRIEEYLDKYGYDLMDDDMYFASTFYDRYYKNE